jgi:peptidyl-tRNA hydrolase, PTH1 family
VSLRFEKWLLFRTFLFFADALVMEAHDYLIVGLGNPGSQYQLTRHNIGFQVVDELAGRWGCGRFVEKWLASTTSFSLRGQKVHFIKPSTFMNLSGKAVAQYYRFFKIDPDQLLVIHDDLDMHPGRIKLVKGGGSGGHNGIKSLVDCLGVSDFYRLKIGIGRPGKADVHPGFPVESYVLSSFGEDEAAHIVARYSLLEDGVSLFLQNAPEKAMSLLNSLK